MIITQVRQQFRMINFINFNLIEQNPQIGFKRNPRIFNCSQNPKLIKLTNIYHEYINIEEKPNDQFQKKRIDSTKIPILKSSVEPCQVGEREKSLKKVLKKCLNQSKHYLKKKNLNHEIWLIEKQVRSIEPGKGSLNFLNRISIDRKSDWINRNSGKTVFFGKK